jgi:hypothetical protein
MRIKNLRTETRESISSYSREIETALVADIESEKFGKTTIWVSVPQKYESYLCVDRYDAFLLALLYPLNSASLFNKI